jgi:uncharacterized protein (TIGR03437 family)
MRITRAIAIIVFSLPVAAQVNVLTYQYDATRDGANTVETVLTPANVNSNQFGKLFSYPVDGQTYGQPLYMANVAVAGKGTHNVVFVATEHDSVYAFDADSNAGANAAPLWQVNFLNPSAGVTTVPASDTGCTQITPEIGITGTPVIDPVSGTIYLVAMTKENGSYVHRLHALDVTNGTEKSGSPMAIQATVPGSGDGGSVDVFVPKLYKQRPGLLLLNGTVYLGMSSHCDIGQYHGWLIGYDAKTLQQTTVYNNTPNGVMGSFWAGGAAPAADSAGNIYVVAGNGTFSAGSGGPDLGESYIKLSTNGGLSVADYFAPFNYASLDSGDLDVGSAGVVLLPDSVGTAAHPHLMAGAGKEGRVYLLDRDNLGKFQSAADRIVQSIPKGVDSLFGNPAYFNGAVYFCTGPDHLRVYPLANGLLGTSTVSQVSFSFPGCVPSFSANGSSNGIAWTLDSTSTLRAFDASNVANELYDSNQNSGRDALGSYVKFSVPAIANGKVYAGTSTNLSVYGLLSPQVTITNAAGGQAGAAPGSLITIKGSALAQSTAAAITFPLPPTLGGASVTINGIPAPLLYASTVQINAQVPFGISPGSATLTVNSGTAIYTASLTIQNVAPGLFVQPSGQAAVDNADGTINSPSQGATSGSYIAAYLTGLGAVDNAVADGAAASTNPLSSCTGSVTATVGGKPSQVLFAGLAPGFAGLYQVNILLPQLSSGNYALQVSVNGVAGNSANVTIH